MGIAEATDSAVSGLEAEARRRLEEDNKKAISAMDAEITSRKKEYFKNKSTPATALMEAKRKKEKFYQDNLDKYYLENSAMAAKPGEDPNMLYESQNSAKARTVSRYENKVEQEKVLVEAQEKELAGLKDKKKEIKKRDGWGGWLMKNSTVAQALTGYKDPDRDEISNIDKRIGEIEGKRHGDVGSLEASKARLAMWKKEAADPSVVEREVIGKNEWTGTSAMPYNDLQFDGSRRAKISPDGSTMEVETPIRRSLGAGAETDAAYRASDAAVSEIAELTGEKFISGLGGPIENKIEGNLMKSTFQIPEQYRESMIASMKDAEPASASDAVLEQNIEQTKKLGTVEEASARSLEPGSIYTHDIHLEKLLAGVLGDDKLALAASTTAGAIETASIQQATPVGQHAIPVVREDGEGAADVQPVHLRDIAESILKDKVGGESGTGKLQSDELARMEEISNRQYAEMQQIREGIQEMVSLMKPSGSVVGSGSGENPKTKFARQQVRPTVYGQMRDGKPGSGPNRSVYKSY